MKPIGGFGEQIIFEEQRALWAFWEKARLGDRLPSRKDISPMALRDILPWISVLERQADGRILVRLAGTGLRDIFDCDITGRHLEDVPYGETFAYWSGVHEAVIQDGRPRAGIQSLGAMGRAHAVQVWARLPLASDGVTVDAILAFDLMRFSADLPHALRVSLA